MVHAHPSDREPPPWGDARTDARVAFCTLWTTGPDSALDGVFRWLAMRPSAEGGWETFDRFTNPFSGDDGDAATARMAREYGVTRADLAGAGSVEDAWRDFRDFVADFLLIVPEADVFEGWWSHFDSPAREPVACVGLAELCSLLQPGRLRVERDGLATALLPQDDARRPPRAVGPADLQAAMTALVARFQQQSPAVLRVAAVGYARAYDGMRATDPSAAGHLARALSLVEEPEAWAGDSGLLFDGSIHLRSGVLSEAARGKHRDSDLLAGAEARYVTLAADWTGLAPLPPHSEEPTPFPPADLALLDDLFRVHLPAVMRSARPGASDDFYRKGQHEVALEVARTLGSDELLLVHAPTGTGKTLAYLLPALLWAKRHELRVGIATYTRTLQEQARDRELPTALTALARAGVTGGFRIALLKGRENYVCGRSLRLVTPADDDDAEAWLAWTGLALFTLTDSDGDLDRFAARPPLPLSSSAPYRRAIAGLLRQVRARTGCCIRREHKDHCAAEIARRKAERSHVVITNQSFALARQEFFQHVIFDECEHLHAQAHNAWSYDLSLRRARDMLDRLHRPGRETSRAPLDRIGSAVLEGSPTHAAWRACVEVWEDTVATWTQLGHLLEDFEAWRKRELSGGAESTSHSLLREYVEGLDGRALVEARKAATARGNALDVELAGLIETLGYAALRSKGRIRRALDGCRIELAEVLTALEAWIPLDDGQPRFRPETFYDVERDARGGFVLAARVLLPNEYLGRNYYPRLASAAFLSASTWIRGSFDSAKGFLGLDRAAEPRPEEERPGRKVRTFRAPEAFDYSQVLVAVPRDAPPVARDKDAFLLYVRHFLAWLGERTRGRILALFTNSEDVKRVGAELTGFFRARRIPLWYQGMEGVGKEELSELFRGREDSILLGVDTFWYGADFPGETLEYLVLIKLPYGVPDRYHQAQCAVLGREEQRRRIYLPRALAKFRQGFGRLVRRSTDRGCVFVLDGRILDPRHRNFLRELPLADSLATEDPERGARFVRAETDRCAHEALSHMGMLSDVRRRGLSATFAEAFPREHREHRGPGRRPPAGRSEPLEAPEAPVRRERPAAAPPPPVLEIRIEDLPF